MDPMNLTKLIQYTGYSRIKLTSDKSVRALAEAGAQVEGTGKDWAVSVQQLIDAELVQADGNPFPVARRARPKNGVVSSRKTRFPEIEKSEDLTWLKSEIDAAEQASIEAGNEVAAVDKKLKELNELEQRRRELFTRQADASARAAAARRRFDHIADQVQAEADRIQKNLALLASLKS